MIFSHDLLSNPALGLVKEKRESQVKMAASIEQVLLEGGIYFCEGPVGLGKSYAYLLPAMLAAGRRIVIATDRKQLQDQLLNKDIPTLKKILGNNLTQVLGQQKLATPLKGKGNYACRMLSHKHLEAHPDGGAYAGFLQTSAYGDKVDYKGQLPRWWNHATAENCIGKKCEFFNDCGYTRLKRDASQSHLVVVNQHLLGADMVYGFGRMLGGPYDTLIIDEAHTLATGIRSAFTHKITEQSIAEILDLLRGLKKFASLTALTEAWPALFDNIPNKHYREANARDVPVFNADAAKAVLLALNTALGDLAKEERLYGDDTSDASYDDDCEENNSSAFMIDGQVVEPSTEGIEIDAGAQREIAKDYSATALATLSQAKRKLETCIKGLTAAQGIVESSGDVPLTDDHKANILANTVVYAAQDERGKFSINCAPVNVGGIVGKYLAQIQSVVVCSATLAIEEGFGHIINMTGVHPTKSEILPTSFNYDSQGFVYIPRDLPVVTKTAPQYNQIMARRTDEILKLVTLSNGGAFVLTTSNEELDIFTTALKREFPGRVFAQGHSKNMWDGEPSVILNKFLATQDSILVGSKSFWSGVDVQGKALRLVIIAKLPFPQYGDPIIKARERLAGDRAFNDVQLTDMLVDLRQGVGRLIRSVNDRGCVAILDSRVWDKRYGGSVLKALPWSPGLVTSKMSVCEAHLPKIEAFLKSK